MLDGVTSALAAKEYLRGYGIKTIAAHKIQYGDAEYSPKKPQPGTLAVMVDFAHGKTYMKIHTDHHSGQVGYAPGTSIAFQKSPSNVSYISQIISNREIFPPEDLEIIDTVDSANFVAKGVQPNDILRATFSVDKSKSVEKNRWAMGLATNELLLAYKNKPEFLNKLVMLANPSLLSMFRVIRRLAAEEGYKPPEEVETDLYNYLEQQKKATSPTGSIMDLKSGQHTMFGKTIVQYGGGSMSRGKQYDRYTPFRIYPDAHYIIIAWPMGMIQVSKNPFIGKKNKYNLIEVTQKVLKKYEGKFRDKKISLSDLKRMSESSKDMGPDSMGFSFNDFISHYKNRIQGIKNIEGESDWKTMIADITNKPFKELSYKQKEMLGKVYTTLWDVIEVQSGGHFDISNIQAINFWGKGYVDLMKKMMYVLALEMKDKRLE